MRSVPRRIAAVLGSAITAVTVVAATAVPFASAADLDVSGTEVTADSTVEEAEAPAVDSAESTTTAPVEDTTDAVDEVDGTVDDTTGTVTEVVDEASGDSVASDPGDDDASSGGEDSDGQQSVTVQTSGPATSGPVESGSEPSPSTSTQTSAPADQRDDPAADRGTAAPAPADTGSPDEAPPAEQEVELPQTREQAATTTLAQPPVRQALSSMELVEVADFGVLPPMVAPPSGAPYVPQGGPRSTAPIIEAFGASASSVETIARILAPFPVAGPASYTDDWGAPRHVPSYHPHAGTDIFAERGTPVIASADGVVTHVRRGTAIGGNSLHVTTPDGTFYYYAHLEGFAAGIGDGTAVSVGEVIGYVGDSGNARGTPPHLHYQIHPDGGAPVSPIPFLDRWLEEALSTAQLLGGSTAARPVFARPAARVVGGAEIAATGPVGVGQWSEPVPAGTSAPAPRSNPATSLAAYVLIIVGVWLLLRRRRSPVPLTQDRREGDGAAPLPPTHLLAEVELSRELVSRN